MPWPRATARWLTAHKAMPSPWWTCSRLTPPSASARSMATAWATASWESGSMGSTSALTQHGAIPEATKARVVERQQASLDPDAPRDEQFAELEDPLLSLICRHQIRKHRPGGNERAAAFGVGLDGCRGAQRNGNTGARGADRAQRHGARPRLERLAAVAAVGVQVHGSGAGCYRIACLGGEFFGRARCCGMVAIAVERRL